MPGLDDLVEEKPVTNTLNFNESASESWGS